MTREFYCFIAILCNNFISLRCNTDKTWDLLYVLKSEKNIQLTEDFTLKLTSSTNYSQMFLSAEELFTNYSLDDEFIIYTKMKIKKKLTQRIILFALKDSDVTVRLELSFRMTPGYTNKIVMHVVFNPISVDKSSKIIKKFIIPFKLTRYLTFAIRFTNDKIILYTCCGDTRKPFGYQSSDLPKNIGKILFKDKATLRLLIEENNKRKLQGEIFELSFSNFMGKIRDLCINDNWESSGEGNMNMIGKMYGNSIPKTIRPTDGDSIINLLTRTKRYSSKRFITTKIKEIAKGDNQNINISHIPNITSKLYLYLFNLFGVLMK